LLPGEGVRVGAAPVGWEVPCIARPGRRKHSDSGGVPLLASVSEDLVARGAEGVEEPAGGWVEDLNGLLGFNKGFRGRYVDNDNDDM
jgi:hypothetical protein